MRPVGFALSICTVMIWAGVVMGIEEAKYAVVETDGIFELRSYAPQIVAETIVSGTLEDAGGLAFSRLFGYISGENLAQAEIPMTGPVTQVPRSGKIAMTAPVGQRRTEQGWAVSFMMPASYTMETLPRPKDPSISLRQVPARRMAAVRYSGFWSEKNYARYRAELESWMRRKGLTSAGEPVWARYNPPFMPWFLRRNEILIPVE